MALKNKSLKKSLTEKAVENATVTKGSSKEQEVIKEGVPRDLHTIQKPMCKTVGVSVGSTINMGDYQSLRADVWLTDEVAEYESFEMAYARVFKVAHDTLEQIVNTYV